MRPNALQANSSRQLEGGCAPYPPELCAPGREAFEMLASAKDQQRWRMAKAIRAKREAAGLTQQELATRLGRSIANIRAWERLNPPAAIPGGAIAVELAEVLGTTLKALHIGRGA